MSFEPITKLLLYFLLCVYFISCFDVFVLFFEKGFTSSQRPKQEKTGVQTHLFCVKIPKENS
jgi:hypothetical protein